VLYYSFNIEDLERKKWIENSGKVKFKK
jgi:hypothetical protein